MYGTIINHSGAPNAALRKRDQLAIFIEMFELPNDKYQM